MNRGCDKRGRKRGKVRKNWPPLSVVSFAPRAHRMSRDITNICVHENGPSGSGKQSEKTGMGKRETKGASETTGKIK